MKGVGIILLVAGLIGAVFALSMDTSVSTGYGSVNNIGLMAEKQNTLLFAGIAAIVGAILFGFASVRQGDKTAILDETILDETLLGPLNRVVDAIRLNNIEALRSAILAGDDCLTKSPKNGMTPLEFADALDHFEIAALLRKYEASLKSAE